MFRRSVLVNSIFVFLLGIAFYTLAKLALRFGLQFNDGSWLSLLLGLPSYFLALILGLGAILGIFVLPIMYIRNWLDELIKVGNTSSLHKAIFSLLNSGLLYFPLTIWLYIFLFNNPDWTIFGSANTFPDAAGLILILVLGYKASRTGKFD